MNREFFLYSRTGCRPCEDFMRELEAFLEDTGDLVHVVKVDNDAELEHRYGARIPVLVCGTTEICELHFDATSLQSFLSRAVE